MNAQDYYDACGDCVFNKKYICFDRGRMKCRDYKPSNNENQRKEDGYENKVQKTSHIRG